MAESDSTRQIWIVFWILFVLTTVEVLLGIFKPTFLTTNSLIGVSLLNHTFIILTLVKAYYIVGTFMHLGHEKKSLQLSIVVPMWILVPYLLFILLAEASYHGAIG
tara:strand:- start:520 stop:837 length:318 start_codon:yes stop_codon:yes gene_type:complete